MAVSLNFQLVTFTKESHIVYGTLTLFSRFSIGGFFQIDPTHISIHS